MSVFDFLYFSTSAKHAAKSSVSVIIDYLPFVTLAPTHTYRVRFLDECQNNGI